MMRNRTSRESETRENLTHAERESGRACFCAEVARTCADHSLRKNGAENGERREKIGNARKRENRQKEEVLAINRFRRAAVKINHAEPRRGRRA